MAERKSKAFPGMKKSPYPKRSVDKRKKNGRKKGSSNKLKGEIKDKVNLPNSARAGFRNESNINSAEFMKVLPGETQEEWELRTRKRRNNVHFNKKIKVAKNGSLLLIEKKLSKVGRDRKISMQVEFIERPHVFLENYAFVMRWATVKYDILKDDIELGMVFYRKKTFTKEEFDYVCSQLGAVRGVWSRFKKKEYVVNMSIMSSDGIIKETEHYSLSLWFANAIKRIYGMITKTTPIILNKRLDYPRMEVELIEKIEEMNQEIYDILSGNKKPDTFNSSKI